MKHKFFVAMLCAALPILYMPASVFAMSNQAFISETTSISTPNHPRGLLKAGSLVEVTDQAKDRSSIVYAGERATVSTSILSQQQPYTITGRTYQNYAEQIYDDSHDAAHLDQAANIALTALTMLEDPEYCYMNFTEQDHNYLSGLPLFAASRIGADTIELRYQENSNTIFTIQVPTDGVNKDQVEQTWDLSFQYADNTVNFVDELPPGTVILANQQLSATDITGDVKVLLNDGKKKLIFSL